MSQLPVRLFFAGCLRDGGLRLVKLRILLIDNPIRIIVIVILLLSMDRRLLFEKDFWLNLSERCSALNVLMVSC